MGDAKREAAESKSAFSLERTSPIHSLTIEPEYDADDNAMAGGAVHGLSEYSSTDDPRFLLHTQSGWYFDTVAGTFCGWNSSGHLQYYNPAEPLTDETMRLVVKASDIVPVGSVVLVDAAGLSIGRDSNPFEKRLRLKEIAVSRCHATIYLDTSITANTDGDKTIPQDMPFCVVDTGSVHGTFVNDQRLSPSKEASAPMVLKHNDCLRLGSTVLVIHQHPRWSCSECVATALNTLEINPIQPATSLNAEKASERPQAFSKELKEKARIQELKRLKRTLTEPSLECVPHSSSASSRMPSLAEKWNADCSLLYVDRAAKRRALYSSSSDHDSTPYIISFTWNRHFINWESLAHIQDFYLSREPNQRYSHFALECRLKAAFKNGMGQRTGTGPKFDWHNRPNYGQDQTWARRSRVRSAMTAGLQLEKTLLDPLCLSSLNTLFFPGAGIYTRSRAL
ncbi:hypothetical protein BASA60_011289 [Batrachochytrium salamandrivorans]|nr:hypothetical protein BASA60_011289 [Batrachochytrium salamandrivorans]